MSDGNKIVAAVKLFPAPSPFQMGAFGANAAENCLPSADDDPNRRHPRLSKSSLVKSQLKLRPGRTILHHPAYANGTKTFWTGIG